MARVYFATNRSPDATKAGGFGAGIVAPEAVTYAAIDVASTDLADESSGTLGAIIGAQPGSFVQPLMDEIIGAGKNILVFIHGFDNAFDDAIKRAAFNRDWFAATEKPPADTVVVAFSWPSLGELFDGGDLEEAYRTDQKMAGASGQHLANFIKVIGEIRTKIGPTQRIFLLAHSMGNFALQAAIAAWFAQGNQGFLLFDEVILAAADEVEDTFIQADQTRLTRLPSLSGRISIYSSRRDVAMSLSHLVNNTIRLGFDGPQDYGDTSHYPSAQFPADKFRSIDCTEVYDYFALYPPDATHQYYRRSKTVRSDIGAVMADLAVPPGRSALSTSPLAEF